MEKKKKWEKPRMEKMRSKPLYTDCIKHWSSRDEMGRASCVGPIYSGWS